MEIGFYIVVTEGLRNFPTSNRRIDL